MHKERLGSFLQCEDGVGLPTQPDAVMPLRRDKVRCHFPDQPGKRQFAQQQVARLLVVADFTQGDGPGPVATRFALPSARRCSAYTSIVARARTGLDGFPGELLAGRRLHGGITQGGLRAIALGGQRLKAFALASERVRPRRHPAIPSWRCRGS